MSFDVEFQSVDLDYLGECYGFLNFNMETPEKSFHEAICTSSGNPYRFIQATYLNRPLSNIDSKAQKIVQNHRIAPMGNINGEIGGKISWGGEDGVQASGYVSGSASDNNGNTVEATVEVNSDGSGNASVSASHEEKTDS